MAGVPTGLYLCAMLLYNVTIGIDREIEKEWLVWMKTEYIPAIMETGMFVDYKIYKILHDEQEPTVSYSVQYFAETLEDVSQYLEKHEPVLGETLRLRFQDRHVAFRTLLDEV